MQDIARALGLFPSLLEKRVQLLHGSVRVDFFGALDGGVLEHVIFALVNGFSIFVFDALGRGLLDVFCALGAFVLHFCGGGYGESATASVVYKWSIGCSSECDKQATHRESVCVCEERV